VSDTWTYTGFGEAQGYVAAAGSTALYALSFTRDNAGRISTKTETLGGVTSVYAYTYDAARGWLTDVSSNGLPTAHYDYDDNGNRTDALTLDREVSFAAADGQDRITGGTLTQPLQAAQNVSWSYTANGEVAGRTVGTATTLFSYDVRGNLRDVTLTNGVRIEYLVDATGRRLGRKVGGTLTRGWLYQDGLKPVAELDGGGNVVSRFVYGGKANVPEYLVKNGAEYRLITDQLGSVRLVVNAADGSLAQRLDYDEFGRVLNDSNPGFQPFGYAGGLYDPDTGLVRFGARDYDADAGRWMSKDPIGFEGGNNWYAYCGNEPINQIDPHGHDNIYGKYSAGTWNNNVPNITLSMPVTTDVNGRITSYISPIQTQYNGGMNDPLLDIQNTILGETGVALAVYGGFEGGGYLCESGALITVVQAYTKNPELYNGLFAILLYHLNNMDNPEVPDMNPTQFWLQLIDATWTSMEKSDESTP